MTKNSIFSLLNESFNTNRKNLIKEIYDNLNVLIMIQDPQGRILFFNQTCEELSGYSKQEVLNHFFWEIIVPKNEISRTKNLFKKGHSWGSKNLPWQTKQLGPKLIRWTADEIKDEHNSTAYRIFTGIDITEQENAKAALKDKAEKLHQVTDNIKEVFWMMNAEHTETVFINPAYEEIWGRPCQELIDNPTNWIEHIYPDDIGRIQSAFAQNWRCGKFNETYRIIRPDNSIRWIHDRAFPVYDHSGEVYRIAGIALDVTEHVETLHELLKSEQTLGAILHNIQEGIIAVNESGIIKRVNPKLQEIFGFQKNEMIGQPLSILMQSSIASEHQQKITDYLKTNRSEIMGVDRELTAQRKDGSTFPMLINVTHIKLDQENLFIGAIRDISQQKADEAIILKSREAAENANRAKSEFLSRMSHELRTPLNAVIGFSQLLNFDNSLSNNQKDSVKEIFTAGKHLLELINEVLDLAQIESGRVTIDLENISLKQVISESINLITPLANESNITVEYDEINENQFVLADRIRFKETLLNLLSNAIKYNRNNGRVKISHRPYRDSYIKIEIKDSGYGLENDQIKLLFSPFQRLGRERPAIKGTGIGLAISKQLIEIMGGKIEVESMPGIGSTFRIIVPKAEHVDIEETLNDLSSTLSIPDTTNDAQLLYIEDNPANLLLVKNLIEMWPGIELLSATTAEHGIEIIKNGNIDLVLMDIELPGINGYEAMTRLKSQPQFNSIPVLAVSANAMPSDIAKGIDMGFAEYLTKPLDINKLCHCIEKHLDIPTPFKN